MNFSSFVIIDIECRRANIWSSVHDCFGKVIQFCYFVSVVYYPLHNQKQIVGKMCEEGCKISMKIGSFHFTSAILRRSLSANTFKFKYIVNICLKLFFFFSINLNNNNYKFYNFYTF